MHDGDGVVLLGGDELPVRTPVLARPPATGVRTFSERATTA